MSIVLNLLFYCFRHPSVQKIRPKLLKSRFVKVADYCKVRQIGQINREVPNHVP